MAVDWAGWTCPEGTELAGTLDNWWCAPVDDGGAGGGELDCSTEAVETIEGRYVECFGPVDTGSWVPQLPEGWGYDPDVLAGGFMGVPWLGWLLIAALALAILRSG